MKFEEVKKLRGINVGYPKKPFRRLAGEEAELVRGQLTKVGLLKTEM